MRAKDARQRDENTGDSHPVEIRRFCPFSSASERPSSPLIAQPQLLRAASPQGIDVQ